MPVHLRLLLALSFVVSLLEQSFLIWDHGYHGRRDNFRARRRGACRQWRDRGE